MSKLNKIFFGPAGTGKTREANIEAVRLVCESKELKKYKFNKNDYTNIQKYLNDFSKLSEISDKANEKIIEKINNLSLSVDSVVNTLTFNDIKALVGDGQDRDKAKKNIAEYRIYPLIEMITFHPSYSYQDFVEGISVETNKDTNKIEYKVKDGIFKKICNRAENNPNYNYVLIIDEINRGDIASIFGELFTLLEDNKRKGNDEPLAINLPYSKDDKENPKKLFVPNNLYILATMNTVDKSIALIDVALRRRFDFIECMPKYKNELPELKSINDIDLSKLLETMNKRITILKNEHYQIGHSYFLDIKNLTDLQDVMIKKIIPLLQEYFYDDWKSICAVLNQSYKHPESNGLLTSELYDKKLFLPEFDELFNYVEKSIFKINHKFSKEDIKKVYEQL
ncbi:MAG: AAA family ATPase [Sulfurovaceae bacterium]|nr:AAA family ATPase [Sulfurovaceae bacterium]